MERLAYLVWKCKILWFISKYCCVPKTTSKNYKAVYLFGFPRSHQFMVTKGVSFFKPVLCVISSSPRNHPEIFSILPTFFFLIPVAFTYAHKFRLKRGFEFQTFIEYGSFLFLNSLNLYASKALHAIKIESGWLE